MYSTRLISLTLLSLSSSQLNADWQIGLLLANSDSAYAKTQTETHAIPMLNYIGERFSFINGELQYRLQQTEDSQTTLLAASRSADQYRVQLSASETMLQAGMQARKQALEIGLSHDIVSEFGGWHFKGLMDASNTHEGYELSAGYSYPLQSGRWLLEPQLGVQWQSADLVDYYHGVRMNEATATRPAYQASSSLNQVLELQALYAWRADLHFVAHWQYRELGESIRSSPIIEQNHSQQLIVGMLYSF